MEKGKIAVKCHIGKGPRNFIENGNQEFEWPWGTFFLDFWKEKVLVRALKVRGSGDRGTATVGPSHAPYGSVFPSCASLIPSPLPPLYHNSKHPLQQCTL